MKKYVPAVFFCDNADNTVEYHGMKICKDCLHKLNLLAQELPPDQDADSDEI